MYGLSFWLPVVRRRRRFLADKMTEWKPWTKVLPLEWRDLTVSEDMSPQSYNLFAYIPADILGIINSFLTSLDRCELNQVAEISERVRMGISSQLDHPVVGNLADLRETRYRHTTRVTLERGMDFLERHFKAFPLADAELRYKMMVAESKATSLTFDIGFLLDYHNIDSYDPEVGERIDALIVASGWKPDLEGAGLTAIQLFFQLCDFVKKHDILYKYNPVYAGIMANEIHRHWDVLFDLDIKPLLFDRQIAKKDAALNALHTGAFIRSVAVPYSYSSYFSDGR